MTKPNDAIWCVYMHINKINNKKYIGITSKQPEKRWKNGLGYNKDSQSRFYNAIQKYTWDGFDHIIIAEGLTEIEAKQMEVDLIAIHKTNCCRYQNPEFGYNMTDGGDGTVGRTFSEETRQKIREKSIGREVSKETRKKQSESKLGNKNFFYGKHHTEETKKILSDKNKEYLSNPENHGMYGKSHSEESKKKNTESQIKKPVVQLDKNGKFVAEFISINEAEKCTGIQHLHISRCCHHILHYNTAGGYFWLFKNEYEELSRIFDNFGIIQHLYPSIAGNINGVNFRQDRSKWVAHIKIKGKTLSLGFYLNKEDAIRARLEAEAKYFKEFAPQRHLFDQYGITIQNELDEVI